MLIALAAIAGAVVCAACFPSPIDEELPVGLPNRKPVVTSAEASTEAAMLPSEPAPAADAASPEPRDAGADTYVETQAALLCAAPDLVLCFAFEGKVADGSPNALAPTTVSGVTFVSGKVGQAASFGPASAVRFAPSQSLELTTATIEAWIKLAPNPTGDGVIFDDDNRASLTILQDGTVHCKPNAAVVSAKILADQWTHVACVFDGAKAHVYVAGDELGSGTGQIGSSPTSTAAIGGNAPSGEPFVGELDSLRVFRVARTPADIAAAAGK